MSLEYLLQYREHAQWLGFMLALLFFLWVGVKSVIFRRIKGQIEDSFNRWRELTSYESGYFNYYALQTWLDNCPELIGRTRIVTILLLLVSYSTKKKILKLKDQVINAHKYQSVYNEAFIKHELREYESFFENIEGSNLDDEQRRATLINEDNTLVVAGAGTGKTKTIMAKISYLFDKYGLEPERLLLISFTNKSCDEMRERLKRLLPKVPQVKTFHKLGLDIIKQVEAENHPSVSSFSQKQFHQIISSIYQAELKTPAYQRLMNRFFVEYLIPYKDPREFESQNEAFQHLQQTQNYSFKMVETKNKDGRKLTYREQLKSQEEVSIANFLFFNQIKYEYEASYRHETTSKEYSQYKPDFHLPDYGIYIEHFAIDKKNNVPKWFKGTETKSAKQVYLEGMKWKRKVHKQFNTKLVETYSWEKYDGVLLENLQQKLEMLGVEFNPVSEEVKTKLIQRALEEEIASFIHLIGTFLALFKSNNMSLSELRPSQFSMNYLNKRNRVFIEIFTPIYQGYQQFLGERKEIDFSDMINLATSLVEQKRFKNSYQYIIVDEFQDISVGRFRFLSSLIASNPSTKLFCVGDDWQSIYRFTGSDTRLITNFKKSWNEKYVGEYERGTRLQKIETTYRFPESMIELSSSFILKNPRQLKKELKRGNKEEPKESHALSFFEYQYDFEYRSHIHEILEQIELNTKNSKASSVLFLGRYNHDHKVLKDNLGFRLKWDRGTGLYTIEPERYSKISMKFMTVHSAKGLEADYVVLLNVNSGKYGFPSEISDDPVISMVMSGDEYFENAEERRVFYVALTRARKHTYIMTNKNKPSKFVEEINGVGQKAETKLCSECGGMMKQKVGKYGLFWGCINFPLCDHTESIAKAE